MDLDHIIALIQEHGGPGNALEALGRTNTLSDEQALQIVEGVQEFLGRHLTNVEIMVLGYGYAVGRAYEEES